MATISSSGADKVMEKEKEAASLGGPAVGSSSPRHQQHCDTVHTVPTPHRFYETYVRPRRPVLLEQQCAPILNNPQILEQLGSIEKLQQHLHQAGGTAEVNLVSPQNHNPKHQQQEGGDPSKTEEPLPSSSFSPKQGSRVVEMPFAELCSKLLDGCTDYYMTTQTLPLDEEGRPAVCNWLTEALLKKEILPLRPHLLGRLIPMNAANLWLGRTPGSNSSTCTSTSSGLHHDMHDNLYCLLAGQKTVRLAPPESVHQCRMVGRLHTLHDNGRIVYHEQITESVVPAANSSSNDNHTNGNEPCPIRPDGALASVERIVELEMRKEAVEEQLATCDFNINADDEGAQKREQQLEEELNAIEEELLDIEMAGNGNASDAYDDDDKEDDDEEPAFLFGGGSGEKASGSHQDQRRQAKRVKLSSKPPRSAGEKDDDSQSGDISAATKSDDNQSAMMIPPNFVLEESNQVQFQTVRLKAGDTLYLPAGWFHEVFSHGDDSTNGIHLAVNYWVHPPDVTALETKFERPYRSAFWQRDWDARETKLDLRRS